jgi:transcriptional regulator with XRE-family HTH domain
MSIAVTNRGAKRLRRWRQRESHTQKYVGDRIGCYPSQIADYESGKRRPGLETLIAIQKLTAGEVTVEAWAEPVGA